MIKKILPFILIMSLLPSSIAMAALSCTIDNPITVSPNISSVYLYVVSPTGSIPTTNFATAYSGVQGTVYRLKIPCYTEVSNIQVKATIRLLNGQVCEDHVNWTLTKDGEKSMILKNPSGAADISVTEANTGDLLFKTTPSENAVGCRKN